MRLRASRSSSRSSTPLVCNNCQRLEHPEECPHLLHENPPWKNVDATSVARQLYRGDTKLMMAETMGAMQAGGGLIFSSAHIDRMAANPAHAVAQFVPGPRVYFHRLRPQRRSRRSHRHRCNHSIARDILCTSASFCLCACCSCSCRCSAIRSATA